MAKKLKAIVKIQINAGKATPAPPVGTALGPHGIPLMQFCKEYNAKTSGMIGQVVPVEISIFADNSYSFILKSPPAAVLLKEAAGIKSGSATPNKDKVGTVTRDQLAKIAETKMKDLNANDIDNAIKIIAGTARSMGLIVED